jgi:hypothetical protein
MKLINERPASLVVLLQRDRDAATSMSPAVMA